MKKLLLSAAIIAIALTGCNDNDKNNEPDPPEKPAEVRLNLLP